MTPQQRIAHIQRTLAIRLNEAMSGTRWSDRGWLAVKGGLVGPGTFGVTLHDHEGTDDKHIDLCFQLNRDRPDSWVWDCASGFGENVELALEEAVETWMVCTFPVILEMLEQSGEYAEHLGHEDPMGLPGWHCIHGPVLGFGGGASPQLMQQWVLEHPLLPALADLLPTAFDRKQLNGIKFLFGGDVAEVRVNGQVHEEASLALHALDWPRTEPFAFARVFVLALHR